MFNAGFEKIAVSMKLVDSVIGRNKKHLFNNPATGSFPLPAGHKFFTRSSLRTKETMDTLDKLPKNKTNASLKRHMMRDHISNYRKSHNLTSTKEVNALKKSTTITRKAPAPSPSKKYKALGAIGGAALLGGAGFLTHKYLKKNQKVESQVENNGKVPKHFANDPAYSLMR